tara:strand:- start:1383 stop:1757 length:375 start_codon:yes stop_codon:yes gene_type:complete
MINLKDYRKEVMDLTQKEVADLCNVSVKTIERWESDKYQHKPNKIALRKLAGLYNIQVESLKNTIRGITMDYIEVHKKVTKLDHVLDELTALKDDLYRSSQRNEDRIDWLIEQCVKAKYEEEEE